MMRKFIIVLIILIYLPFARILCQDTSSSAPSNFCSICKGGKHLEAPPYDFNFKKEWPFLALSAASITIGTLSHLINDPSPFTEEELMKLDRKSVFSVDRSATDNWSPGSARASDYVRAGVTLLPAFFLMNHHTKSDLRPLVMMSIEVLTTTYGITQIVKNLVNRPRPFAFNTNLPVDVRSRKNDKLSFFSGHTSHTASLSIFIAKVMSDYHPDAKKGFKIAVWSTATVIPGVAAYLRVRAGKHYPTDVIAGYLVGASIGYLIPHMHKKKKERKEESKKISVLPMICQDGAMLSLTMKF